MVNVTQTVKGVPWDKRTPFERWVEDDLKLDLQRGYAAGNFKHTAVKPWHERGIGASFYDIVGAESLGGLYVGELAPGKSSNPTKQLYDEVIFIIEGSGSTTVETPKGQISFEWGPNSLFAIPLNSSYRLHNGSGTKRARFLSTNTLPIVYNLFRDTSFIYGSDHDFKRIDPASIRHRRRSTSQTPSTSAPRSTFTRPRSFPMCWR
jgi:mannose-6-phosphate isomerase-like protein (cupin superfamily)